MQLAPPVQLLLLTPTPQWVGLPATGVPDAAPGVTFINAPAWEDSVGVPWLPVRVISMLLSRSPAERGFACVLVNTTVRVPAPVVIVAVALQASLQGGVPLFEKLKLAACALPAEAATQAAPSAAARNESRFDRSIVRLLRSSSALVEIAWAPEVSGRTKPIASPPTRKRCFIAPSPPLEGASATRPPTSSPA